MGVNPLTVAPLLIGLVAAHSGLRGSELSGVLFVAIAGYTILPLGFLLWLKQTGRIASIEARNQQQRIGPLWIGAGLLTITGTLVVWRSGTGYSPLLVVSLVFVVNAVLAAVINLRFKMSLHVSSVAGLFSILSALTWISGRYMPGGLPLLIAAGLLIPLLMWARMADQAHSRPEVSVGALFGTLIPAAELIALDVMWPIYG